MSILIALLQLLSLTFGDATFQPTHHHLGPDKSALRPLQGPAPINPCANGCR